MDAGKDYYSILGVLPLKIPLQPALLLRGGVVL
jgi:hypothetical protein